MRYFNISFTAQLTLEGIIATIPLPMPPDVSQPHGLPHLLGSLVILAVFLYITWHIFRPRYVFTVHLTPNGVRVKHGELKPEFLDQLQDLQKQTGLSQGWVRGYQQGRQVRLTFSREFPADCKQRVRNLWAIYK
jgi:hypothetical protein